MNILITQITPMSRVLVLVPVLFSFPAALRLQSCSFTQQPSFLTYPFIIHTSIGSSRKLRIWSEAEADFTGKSDKASQASNSELAS